MPFHKRSPGTGFQVFFKEIGLVFIPEAKATMNHNRQGILSGFNLTGIVLPKSAFEVGSAANVGTAIPDKENIDMVPGW